MSDNYEKFDDLSEKDMIKLGQKSALFYEQIAKHHGLPFQIDDCNEETLATFAATDRGEDLVVCENVEDMFNKLGV